MTVLWLIFGLLFGSSLALGWMRKDDECYYVTLLALVWLMICISVQFVVENVNVG